MTRRALLGACPLAAAILAAFAAVLCGCVVPTVIVPVAATGQQATPPATQPSWPRLYEPLQKACEKLVDELANKLPKGKTVAVLPLQDEDGGVRRLGVIAAGELERGLLAKGIPLADRKHLNALLAEKDLQLATLSSAKPAKRAGELAGADVLLLGDMNHVGEEVLLSCKAVVVDTGRPVAITQRQAIPAKGLGPLMWYVRRPGTAQAGRELPPLALRYEFVSPRRGGELRFGEGSTVRSGQKFKIRVQLNSDCYFYVLLYDSQGEASVLFPHKEIGLGNDVRGGVSYEIPDGRTWYWFDENRGEETFYLVASYSPMSGLDQILAKMEQAGDQGRAHAVAARQEIDTVIIRGMRPEGSSVYRPKGFEITKRGVGITDFGRRADRVTDTQGVDQVVIGHATVVKKLTVRHR